jgi:hypothetical protein
MMECLLKWKIGLGASSYLFSMSLKNEIERIKVQKNDENGALEAQADFYRTITKNKGPEWKYLINL